MTANKKMVMEKEIEDLQNKKGNGKEVGSRTCTYIRLL